MEDQIDILLTFILMGILILILAGLAISKSSDKPKRLCERHDWSHHPETHKLTCVTCNYIPGVNDESEES